MPNEISPSARQEITEYYTRILGYHLRMDGNVPDGSVVFIGDSLTQALYSDAIARPRPSVNYGIGSDTTVGVLARLPKYQSLNRASAVVLAIGVNDIQFRDNTDIVKNYHRILEALPKGLPVVWSAVLPVNEPVYGPSDVNNARILDLNVGLEAVCSAHKHVVFVDVRSQLVDANGNLEISLQDGDGIHLNATGNCIWIYGLCKAVNQTGKHASLTSSAEGLKSR